MDERIQAEVEFQGDMKKVEAPKYFGSTVQNNRERVKEVKKHVSRMEQVKKSVNKNEGEGAEDGGETSDGV